MATEFVASVSHSDSSKFFKINLIWQMFLLQQMQVMLGKVGFWFSLVSLG